MSNKSMTVGELVNSLLDFDPSVKVSVLVNNQSKSFDVLFGGCDGCTKRQAHEVSFYVHGMNEEESNGIE